MLYLTCTMISSVDLASDGVSRAKDLGICGLWYKSVIMSYQRRRRCLLAAEIVF